MCGRATLLRFGAGHKYIVLRVELVLVERITVCIYGGAWALRLRTSALMLKSAVGVGVVEARSNGKVAYVGFGCGCEVNIAEDTGQPEHILALGRSRRSTGTPPLPIGYHPPQDRGEVKGGRVA